MFVKLFLTPETEILGSCRVGIANHREELWLWLKAVTEPNSAKHTAIAEYARTESTGKDGNVRFSDTGI